MIADYDYAHDTSSTQWRGYIYAPTTATLPPPFSGNIESSEYIYPTTGYAEVKLSRDLERRLHRAIADAARANEAIARMRRVLDAARTSRTLQLAPLPERERRGRPAARTQAWGFEHRQRCRTNRRARPLPILQT